MTDDTQQVAVPVSVFFDYICPFCYVASVRLERLAERYPLAVHWRFIETHPANPSSGRPLSELGHGPQQWRQREATLADIAHAEDIPLAEPSFTTNSRRALLLAQATLDQRPERFWELHRALFRAYFVEGLNIGDPKILAGLARRAGVADLVEGAWEGPRYLTRLLEHVEAAQKLGVGGVPTLVLGSRSFTGAVSVETLERALAAHDG